LRRPLTYIYTWTCRCWNHALSGRKMRCSFCDETFQRHHADSGGRGGWPCGDCVLKQWRLRAGPGVRMRNRKCVFKRASAHASLECAGRASASKADTLGGVSRPANGGHGEHPGYLWSIRNGWQQSRCYSCHPRPPAARLVRPEPALSGSPIEPGSAGIIKKFRNPGRYITLARTTPISPSRHLAIAPSLRSSLPPHTKQTKQTETMKLTLLPLISLLPTGVSAGPAAYGVCQAGCATDVMACYAAGGATWG
jgi:hypothetical protein